MQVASRGQGSSFHELPGLATMKVRLTNQTRKVKETFVIGLKSVGSAWEASIMLLVMINTELNPPNLKAPFAHCLETI